MAPIIEVKNIGKKYKIHSQQGGYIALRDVLTNAFRNPFKTMNDKIRGKEDFWALQDINFTVEKGETLGFIGANGAGKSTLLKILSQITPPTTGEIRMQGKVASLLEVGTGFNPELTGRENIYISGAILGMTKNDIKKKFDDIVKFAGVEKFIDTPVKRYSSGMTVRLGFAVAAHLEPEILVIDEVLAVGDVAFQKKCLGKMDEVTKKQGRTILVVSHNMAMIRQLCQNAILLINGQVYKIGDARDVVKYYMEQNVQPTIQLNQDFEIVKFSVETKSETRQFVLEIDSKKHFEDIEIAFGVDNEEGARVFTLFSKWYEKKFILKKGITKFLCEIPRLNLRPGRYTVGILITNNAEVYKYYNQEFSFEILKCEFLCNQIGLGANFGSNVVKQTWFAK